MKPAASFCLVVWMAVSASRACAQTAVPTPGPTPPAPPFLNATPDFSAWTITRYTIPGLGKQSAEAVIRSSEAAAKPDSVTSVTKTGEIRHQKGQVRHRLRKLKTGEQEDIWYEHGNRITMESSWKIPLFEVATSGATQPQGADFAELTWISAKNFVGIQKGQNGDFFVFETQRTEGDENAAKQYGYKLDLVFNRIYVNADTRLPWLVQTGDVLQRYDFQAAPPAMLEVPPAYQAMFDTFEKGKIESARRPVAP